MRWLGEVEKDLSDTTLSEEKKQESVDNALSALTTQYVRKEMPLMPPEREATVIGTGLADRIKSAMASKDAGDTTSHYGQLTQAYNDIVQRHRNTWGGVERNFVEAIQENLLNSNTRNPDVFDFKMREIIKSSDPTFAPDLDDPLMSDPQTNTYTEETYIPTRP